MFLECSSSILFIEQSAEYRDGAVSVVVLIPQCLNGVNVLESVLDRTASVPVAVAEEALLQIAELGGSHQLEVVVVVVTVVVGGGLSGLWRSECFSVLFLLRIL